MTLGHIYSTGSLTRKQVAEILGVPASTIGQAMRELGNVGTGSRRGVLYSSDDIDRIKAHLETTTETEPARFAVRVPKESDEGSRCFDSGHHAVRYAQAQADKLAVPIVVLDRLDGDSWIVQPASISTAATPWPH